jgi:hypothetical protein
MTDDMDGLELKDRLNLIESMIAEGRRKTESWGWTFVLGGVAYNVAIGWATWGRASLAWPVTMIAASVLTGVLAARQAHRGAETTMGRAIGSIWMGMGISMFLLFMAMGISGRFEQHVFVAVVAAMLGGANATSSMTLRWKAQFACAVVWWVASVAAFFGTEEQALAVFLVAIFFCQIVFGIYAMIRDAQERKQRGAAHA